MAVDVVLAGEHDGVGEDVERHRQAAARYPHLELEALQRLAMSVKGGDGGKRGHASMVRGGGRKREG